MMAIFQKSIETWFTATFTILTLRMFLKHNYLEFLSLNFPPTLKKYYTGGDGITSVPLSIHNRYHNTNLQWDFCAFIDSNVIWLWTIGGGWRGLLCKTSKFIPTVAQTEPSSEATEPPRNQRECLLLGTVWWFTFLAHAEFDQIILCTTLSRNLHFRATLLSPTSALSPVLALGPASESLDTHWPPEPVLLLTLEPDFTFYFPIPFVFYLQN